MTLKKNSSPRERVDAGNKKGNREPASDRRSPEQDVYLQTLVGDGLKDYDIQARCKSYTPPFHVSVASIQYYRRKLGKRRQEVLQSQTDKVVTTGFALAKNRIEVLQKLVVRMLKDVLPDDGEDEHVWLVRAKTVANNPYVYKEFNSAQIIQLRGLLDDLAKETGGRDPKAQADASAFAQDVAIPAHLMAPMYGDVYRDIRANNNLEYLFRGGRGSTKSSFVGEVIVELLANNPTMHALALRQVGNTLRDSVYAQIKWAINEMGLMDRFKFTTNPLEIEYIPTGQRIYFRGGDDPVKIKSIKPSFGYIGIVWFEELDQFRGPEAVRNIEQSAIRGGDRAWVFKSFNPPKSASNWANKYSKVPKANQYIHFSNYLGLPEEYLLSLVDAKGSKTKLPPVSVMADMFTNAGVPKSWLGKPWLDEARHLLDVNFNAWLHEYGGIATGIGGLVFDNVEIRTITNEEIAEFDRVMEGLDWGYFPDPLNWGRMHYDAARMVLYIYDELRLSKTRNKEAYNTLVRDKGIGPALMIADSAEPKSIADFRDWGANIRAAEKGPESVNYSMKWLQSLNKIVIDSQRAPYHTEEFLNYEMEQDRNGEWLSAYPDKNNHAIDDTRYATNLIWRRRGQ